MWSRKRSVRFWILLFTVLANLAVAGGASADWTNAVCEDRETHELYLCCRLCFFFCYCEFKY